MKKLLLITILAFATQFMMQAQEKILTKVNQFSSISGTLLQKEFINVGKIRALEIRVIKITDLNSGAKISGLRLEYTFPSANPENHIASLDVDEIEGFIKSIKNIQTNVFPTIKTNYTEYVYRSRCGFEFGTSYNEYALKWVPYVQLNKYSTKSFYPLGIDDISTLLKLVQKAQEMLK